LPEKCCILYQEAIPKFQLLLTEQYEDFCLDTITIYVAAKWQHHLSIAKFDKALEISAPIKA
jgi:hypothetical protein